MSLKLKLSVTISLLVFFMLLTNFFLHDYSTRIELREQTHREMDKMAEQLIFSHNSYDLGALMRSVAGPEQIRGELAQLYPWALELVVFEREHDRKALAESQYMQAEADYEALRKAAAGEKQYMAVESQGLSKGFYPLPDEQALGIVMDSRGMIHPIVYQNRMKQAAISGVLLLLIIVLSYRLAGFFVHPLQAILWKVNEVSLGRFQTVIPVKRKDELGQLAARINAMSKNLDIYTTKLKQAFEENRSMKEFLESFINHTTDAIHVVDLEGRITQINYAFEQLFGWSAQEAVGAVLPLVPGPYAEEEQQALLAVRSGKVLGARESVRQTRDGSWISVSVTTSPIRDRNGTIRFIANISRDMTSRNKMEELLRQSEKLTTVGQLAAGVAHEIRNPLTTLRGFLQLQQQTKQLNPRHNDLMLSELDRINLIVSEFLILAKPQAVKFEQRDVRYVMGDVISLLDSQAHLCNIIFNTDFCTQSCEISCEENQLKQVFINILKNAIEAMPQGGQIAIRVARDEEQAVVITIVDEGTGIPQEMIPKLGDPFFTGKETGTGLGIMVSQRIIHNHQGVLRISSRLNEGTTVEITLPRMHTRASEGAREESGTVDERSGGAG